ncbi:MAG: hypothetical protein LBP59_20125 [Planctomycetaceae bacterium]|nr:hypothetical protein [Planctomycetaceae bacterium]
MLCLGVEEEVNKPLTKINVIKLPESIQTTKYKEIKKIFFNIQDDLASFRKGDIEATIKKHVKEKQKEYKKYKFESISVVSLSDKNGIFVIKYIFSIDDMAKCFFFDKNGNLAIYINGQIDINKHYSVENSGDDKNERNNFENYRINGNGLEIIFHPTGFPKSYTKIVRNRLYGRQIEWNDKGDVISDVDLDIPKEWKDAPKKIEKTK